MSEISFKVGNLDGLKKQDVLSVLNQLMENTLRLTKDDLTLEISKIVPKNTGLLRQTLQNSLNASQYNGSKININLNSTEYGSKVNSYSTNQVRGEKDPEAIGGYADHLFREAKFRLKLNWKIAKNNLQVD